MGSRRKAREAAVQMLYQMDVPGVDAKTAIETYWPNLAQSQDEMDFANAIVHGVDAGRSEIDGTIRKASLHWRLERMSRVDRNILRAATYELLHADDIPVRVTLNEAVELAKHFGDEDSPAFVNGVLDRIASSRDKG